VGALDGGSDASGEDTGANGGFRVGDFVGDVVGEADDSEEGIGADVAEVGDGSTALIEGDAVKDTGRFVGKKVVVALGVEAGGTETVGKAVMVADGLVGLGARLPVAN
jgi:hypothetical protein